MTCDGAVERTAKDCGAGDAAVDVFGGAVDSPRTAGCAPAGFTTVARSVGAVFAASCTTGFCATAGCASSVRAAKNCTTNVTSFPSYMPRDVPMPTCVYCALRILARCIGEFIQAVSTSCESSKSSARFSPAYVYGKFTESSQCQGVVPSSATCAKYPFAAM